MGKGGSGMKQSYYRGCLLGLAVGDAMGYTVDGQSWQEIVTNYGPNGLLGYDLVNGYADVTSYTQLAAFTCNGLLIALTRGQMTGKMLPLFRYVGLSSREWAASQRPWGRPGTTFCWLLQQPEMCRRRCMDTRMLDALSRDTLGTLEDRLNSSVTPGSLTSAASAGLFGGMAGMPQQEIDLLGAEVVGVRRTVHPNTPCPEYCLRVVDQAHMDAELAEADLVALSLPGTAETYHMFDAARLARCKQGAILLNVGRGTTVDSDALFEAVHSGHLFGAALDVTDPEPLPADHPLWREPNVIITPHISGRFSLPKTLDNIVEIFIHNLKRYAAGQAPDNQVDRSTRYVSRGARLTCE